MKPTIVVASLAFAAIACNGTNGTSTSSELSSSTSSNQSGAGGSRDAMKACFDAFQTCIDGAGDDAAVAACQATLKGCLPAPPAAPDFCSDQPPPPPHEGGQCDGGVQGDRPPPPPGGMTGDGTQPPPPPPGGATGDRTQPPPPPSGGAPDGATRDGDRRPPPPPRFVSPDGRIALATCHAKAVTCAAVSGADVTACRDAELACAKDIIAAEFTAFCADVSSQCTACPDSKACTDLAAKCAAGLPSDPPPPPPAQ